MPDSLRKTIRKTLKADKPEQLSDGKRLTGYKNIYRLRIGHLRAFIFLRIENEENTVVFEYLVPRGQAYDKRVMENLKKKDQ